jgi:hypothetical protein
MEQLNLEQKKDTSPCAGLAGKKSNNLVIIFFTV